MWEVREIQELKKELEKMWKTKVIQVIIEALGTTTLKLKN